MNEAAERVAEQMQKVEAARKAAEDAQQAHAAAKTEARRAAEESDFQAKIREDANKTSKQGMEDRVNAAQDALEQEKTQYRECVKQLKDAREKVARMKEEMRRLQHSREAS